MNNLFLTGLEFNIRFFGIEFYKLTNKFELHNNFKFKTGINIDFKFFDTVDYKCGIYFTDVENTYKWIYYGFNLMKNIRKVTIPYNAIVYVNENIYKTSKLKLILSEAFPLKTYLNNFEIFLKAISYNPIT